MPGYWGIMMPCNWMSMVSSHMNCSDFEVANFDDDENTEIIIQSAEKLIIHDHNGDLEITLTLPEID